MRVEAVTSDAPPWQGDSVSRPASPASADVGDSTADSIERLSALLTDPRVAPLFERLPPFALVDAAARIVTANTAYRELAGDGVLPSVMPMVVEAIGSGRRSARRDALGAGAEQRHARIEVFPVNGLAAIVVHDVTAETMALAKAQREHQRANDIIRASSDWVWETDREGRLTYVSDRIVHSLALPATLLQGRRLDEVVDGPDGSVLATGPLASLQAFRDLAVHARDARGQVRQFSLSGVPTFDETGTFRGFRGTGTDVTERVAADSQARRYRGELEKALTQLRQRNEELDHALQDAQAATRAKSEFLAVMSHELRTPLNAIIGFSEIMSHALFGPLNARYLDYVNDILRSGRHLLNLINDILDFARIENQTLRLQPEPIPVREFIHDALTLVEVKANEKGLTLVRPTENLETRVRVDGTRALQIVENLLSNALKFTPSGGSIGIEVDPPMEGRVRIVIWDTGKGVPAEKQVAIFEMFEQAHSNALARGQEGLGLGLTIARALARQMGGDILLESSTERGSRFAAVFPVA
jgi:PAS domain S-box-containing protein